jgi:UDP-2,3-diacylglucosamine pyrophosphatase LpxH
MKKQTTPTLRTVQGIGKSTHGHRDFLVGNTFLNRINAEKLSDPYVADIYGHPVLLSHGDALCIDDKAYQRYRSHTTMKWEQQLKNVTSWAARQCHFVDPKQRTKIRHLLKIGHTEINCCQQHQIILSIWLRTQLIGQYSFLFAKLGR